jgi:ArsR family transcriptional regulator, arsenate/arsenite/antimonite-responsive transcriptional repressor
METSNMHPTDAPTASDDAREQQVVRALGALAQSLRLRVFRALVQAGPAGLTPSVLQAATGSAAATLSFHLKELTQAGLIAQQRDGRNLHYSARFDQMNALLGYLTEHCCAGSPCDATAAADACCASTLTSTPTHSTTTAT